MWKRKSGRNQLAKQALAVCSVLQLLWTPCAVMAAGQTYNATTDGANMVIFEKYLIMDQEANVPNVTFQYTIRGGNAKDGNVDQQTMEIYAGNDSAKTNGRLPVIAPDQAAFHTGDVTYNQVQASSSNLQAQHSDGEGHAVMDHLTLESGKKYARKEVMIDFSQVQYLEPGIYRYIVEETPSTEYYHTHGITDDTDRDRVLDVYVIDNGTDASGKPKLKIQGYVLHNMANDAAVLSSGISQQETKANGYLNDYRTWNLTISKKVDGNQASRDEYFAFTVRISDAIPGTKYNITGTFDQTTHVTAINREAHTNPTELIIPGTGTTPSELTQIFWLQHNQNIVINGLAENTHYQVYEDAATLNREGYTPSAVITGDTKTGNNEANTIEMTSLAATGTKTMVEDTGIRNDSEVAYKNIRRGTIPTGIFLTAAPFVSVTVMGGIGAAVVAVRKKKREGSVV